PGPAARRAAKGDRQAGRRTAADGERGGNHRPLRPQSSIRGSRYSPSAEPGRTVFRMRTKVALIDDHLLFREGLRAMLASIPDVQVVAEASNHDEAIPAVRNSRPEVVVLDMVLPGSSGAAIARELLREDPRRRVLALSMMTDEGPVNDAF